MKTTEAARHMTNATFRKPSGRYQPHNALAKLALAKLSEVVCTSKRALAGCRHSTLTRFDDHAGCKASEIGSVTSRWLRKGHAYACRWDAPAEETRTDANAVDTYARRASTLRRTRGELLDVVATLLVAHGSGAEPHEASRFSIQQTGEQYPSSPTLLTVVGSRTRPLVQAHH
jgi:hypothetical protein